MVSLLLIAASITGAVLLDSAYEKKHFVMTEYFIKSRKLSKEWNGARLVFLSDLHGNEFGPHNQKLIEAVRSWKPDYILIGGDMTVVKEWADPDIKRMEALLSALSKMAPVIYGNGNHEQRMREEAETYPGWYEEYLAMLKRCGVMYLSNESMMLTRGTEKIRVTGLDIDKKYYEQKLVRMPLDENFIKNSIGPSHPESYEILMAHKPSYVEDYQKWGADLVLSGHYHGGTIRIPFVGGMMTPQLEFFSKISRGVIRRGAFRMIVSAGLGTHSINIRLFNRPEIVCITLNSVPNSVPKKDKQT